MRSACIVSACARPTVTMPIGASSLPKMRRSSRLARAQASAAGNALLHHAAFQFGALGGEAQARIVVQPMRRQREVRRDEAPGGRDDERGGLLGGLGGGLQRDPKSGEARHRDAGEAEVEDVLHRGRVQHRDEHALEHMLGLVRIGRGMRAVVVARHRQHAAMLRGAEEIAAVQRVAGAIDAGPLAVPHAEHAIDALAGEGVELLRAIQHGGGEVLVDAGLEADVLRGQQRLAVPEPRDPARPAASRDSRRSRPPVFRPAARSSRACSSRTRTSAWMPDSRTGVSRSVKRLSSVVVPWPRPMSIVCRLS